MKFLDSSKLNKKHWDELIKNSPKNNVFSYSWYLDATTKKWGAIVNSDYSFGFPFPYKNRILYKQIFQHPYSRNLEFFGDEKFLPNALEILKRLGIFSFHLNHKLDLKSDKKRYQLLDLSQEISYKNNAKRILKKYSNDYHFKITNNIEPVLDFYFDNSFNKIKQQNKNKVFLKQLLQNAIKHNKGNTIEAYNSDNVLVAAAFFLTDKKTVCYLIGDSDLENKKRGVMYCLMDYAIQFYKNDYQTFDFGGSNVKSVATFYQKMGGKDIEYFAYRNK